MSFKPSFSPYSGQSTTSSSSQSSTTSFSPYSRQQPTISSYPSSQSSTTSNSPYSNRSSSSYPSSQSSISSFSPYSRQTSTTSSYPLSQSSTTSFSPYSRQQPTQIFSYSSEQPTTSSYVPPISDKYLNPSTNPIYNLNDPYLDQIFDNPNKINFRVLNIYNNQVYDTPFLKELQQMYPNLSLNVIIHRYYDRFLKNIF